MFYSFDLRSKEKKELINIQKEVAKILEASSVQNGLMTIFVPHSTAGITINKDVEEGVKKEIIGALDRLVPLDETSTYFEGNAPAHIKASLIGNDVTLIINNGRLELGAYQSIFLCEFHGPRKRRVLIKIIEG